MILVKDLKVLFRDFLVIEATNNYIIMTPGTTLSQFVIV